MEGLRMVELFQSPPMRKQFAHSPHKNAHTGAARVTWDVFTHVLTAKPAS